MTIKCLTCGSRDLELIWDNGAEYPNTRQEEYECYHCGETRKITLIA